MPLAGGVAGPASAYTAKDHHFSPGKRIEKQIVLINNTRQPQSFTAAWTATVGGEEVDRGQAQGSLAVSEIRFIPFQVIAPAEPAGGKAEGQLTLTATIGEARHQDTFAFRVFGADQPSEGEIALVDPSGLTGKMLVNLGYQRRFPPPGRWHRLTSGKRSAESPSAFRP